MIGPQVDRAHEAVLAILDRHGVFVLADSVDQRLHVPIEDDARRDAMNLRVLLWRWHGRLPRAP